MSHKKTERNNLLIQYHLDHPEVSLSKVGKIFGIKKQRAHRIIKDYGKEVIASVR